MLSPTIYAQLLKKLPSPIYKVLAQNWINYEFPRHLFIETTTRCQLSCAYCPRPDISRDLPFELLEKAVREASQYGRISFSLHLFGEPLLYPRIAESIKLIKRNGHTVLITTNGILLGEKYKELKEADKIIWSYKEGIEIPEELKSWKNFVVRFIGKEVGSWKRKEVRPLHNYGGSLKSIAQSTEIQRYPCYHPFLAPAVRWNGDIVICCADPKGQSVVGNLRNMTIAEAWKKMDGIRKDHLKGVYKGICEKCDVYKSYPNMFFSWQYGT